MYTRLQAYIFWFSISQNTFVDVNDFIRMNWINIWIANSYHTRKKMIEILGLKYASFWMQIKKTHLLVWLCRIHYSYNSTFFSFDLKIFCYKTIFIYIAHIHAIFQLINRKYFFFKCTYIFYWFIFILLNDFVFYNCIVFYRWI